MNDKDKILLLQNRKDTYKLSITEKVNMILSISAAIISIVLAIIYYGNLFIDKLTFIIGITTILFFILIWLFLSRISEIREVSRQIKKIDRCIYYIKNKEKPKYDIDNFIRKLYLDS